MGLAAEFSNRAEGVVVNDTVRHHPIEYLIAAGFYWPSASSAGRRFGTYAQMSPCGARALFSASRELPARECLKSRAMLLTPWRIARTAAA